MARRTTVTTVAAITLTSLMIGCKPDAAIRKGASVGTGFDRHQQTIPLDPATLGSISGTIHWNGPTPERSKIDMGSDRGCQSNDPNLAEQYAVNHGGLANVFIYIKSGPDVAMHYRPALVTPVVMDQQGCRFVPHLVGVLQGGTIEFRNSDPTAHTVKVMPVMPQNQNADVSQAANATPQQMTFRQVEAMIPVRCPIHPWMNGFVNVSATPFFAISDTDGLFEIKGLPAGNYVLGAVHEKLGEQTITVTVKSQAKAPAEFIFQKT